MSTTADIRLNCTLPNHPKTQKLIRRLGEAAAWNLVVLLAWAGQNRRDGDLERLSDEDIEIAAGWRGAPGDFVAALAEVGFIDGDAGARALHDWGDHQPWQSGARARSDKARWASIKKHHGIEEAARQMPEYAARRAAARTAEHAGRNDHAGDEHPTGTDEQAEAVPDSASSMQRAEPSMPRARSSSPPSPSPYPSPYPRAEDQEQKPPHSPPVGGEPQGGSPQDGRKRQRGEPITFRTYADRCNTAGLPLIADDDPVFRYAERIGLQRGFVELAWWRFSGKYADEEKKQSAKDGWPKKFRNAVEGNWYQLWFKTDDGWQLTTAGLQAAADREAFQAQQPPEGAA